MDRDDLVSIQSAAKRLGLSPRTITQYRWGTNKAANPGPGSQNVGFPPEDFNVDGKPLWYWETIERWARETGRGRMEYAN